MTVGASGLRLDLHNHTAFSPDGLMSPAVLLAAAKARGLSCIAITDHNTIRGALQGAALAESDPTLPRVIPGMELSTRDGEVIGLYLSEEIPSRLTAVEAIVRIKAQGGLVCLPHPFDIPARAGWSR
jgi:predicted metal-dependent phosphoesterase TrpH